MILLYRYNSYIYKNYNGRGVSKIMSSLQKFHRRTNAKSNTLHTGTVSISGTAAVGSVLTASNNIADADGLGTFAYQWKRSGSAISGATGTTYTLVSVDSGNTMTVTITYTDGKGFMETETSAATASVIGPPTLGEGSATRGYYLGMSGDNVSYMYVAPKSTEINGWQATWGSYNIVRGTTSRTDGLGNTNTLFAFGNTTVSGHPAAYYCKTLATGGYNTWYLPAALELVTMYSNKSAYSGIGFNAGAGMYYSSSTEPVNNRYECESVRLDIAQVYVNSKKDPAFYIRPVRRSTI